LLRNASPPPPKTGERPVPGACNNIAATSIIETTICRMVIIITPIIYVLLPEMQVFADHDTEESHPLQDHFQLIQNFGEYVSGLH